MSRSPPQRQYSRSRSRSRSPVGYRGPPPQESRPPAESSEERPDRSDEGAVNPGNNLFVTGISPKCSDEELTELFEKFGHVEKCQIMRDPHTKESRGFAFVQFEQISCADNARESLSGTEFLGRVLTIDRAKRGKERKATPGAYLGPPKHRMMMPPRRFDPRDRPYDRGGYGGRPYDRGYDRGGYDRPYDRGYDRGGYDRRDYPRGGGYHDQRDRYDRPQYDRRDFRDDYGGGGRPRSPY